MRRLLLATLLLTAACSGSSGHAVPAPSPSPSTTASPTTFPYPAEAGRVSPLPVPPAYAGELARATNNLTPLVRTAALTVTVPAGKALATDVVCQGRGSVVISTRPVSDAALTVRCDGSAVPTQIGKVASRPASVTTRYVVTVRATGPSRWLVAVSARAAQ